MFFDMLYRKYLPLSILSYFILLKCTTVYGIIDPFTGSIVLTAFVAGYFIKNPMTYFKTCPKTFNIHELQQDMENRFFGQHIASEIILSALKGNSLRSKYNKKPLVMTFHGRTGSGKNFISDLIAQHMFGSEKIKRLRYHVINGQSEYPEESKLSEYKLHLYEKVKSAINSCDTNLFIFDEIQYIPSGLMDVIIPILENHDDSVDSRNSIFIMITNAGSDAIVKKCLEHWNKGGSREQMEIHDFDKVLQISAFNEIGGLRLSHLIDSHIIDHYVPFLPLEKKHVLLCIDAELKQLNKYLDPEKKNKILKIFPFGPNPEKLFSTYGCKRISQLVSTNVHTT